MFGQLFLFMTSILTLPSNTALAGDSLRHSGNFGLGLGGGNFAGGSFGGGLSGKYWLSDKSALQATISGTSSGWGVTYSSSSISADYLIEMPLINSKDEWELGWNFGPGAGIAHLAAGTYSATSIGISAVVGLEVNLTVIPIDIVVEYRPLLQMGNTNVWTGNANVWTGNANTGVTIVNTSTHIRYYFN